MDIDQVKRDINLWIENFLEVPNEKLNNWSPCPYARQARILKTYDVRLGVHPYWDLYNLSNQGIGDRQVVIIVYDPNEWEHKFFSNYLETANENFLNEKDLIVLEDHPYDAEIVNGVSMNQGTYALSLVQSLSDLNAKSAALARQGFYESWSEEYLKNLFKFRKDPRK